MSYPFYDLDSHEQNKGELLSKILVYGFEQISKKGRTCVLCFLFLSRVSWDQRWSETPKFATNKMHIRGLHPPKVTATFKILNSSPLHLKSPIELII